MRKGECFEDAIKTCFKNVPVNEILKGSIRVDEFPKEHFRYLLLNYLKEYSDTELDGLYEWVCERTKGSVRGQKKSLNLFICIMWLASQLLLQAENGIECRYSELLRWRNLTSVLGEDLLICAYLSEWSVRNYEEWIDFQWAITLPHNNTQLNRILERGLSENHFHLYGSAPIAHLLWQALMNHVCSPELTGLLKKVNQKRRSTNAHYFTQYRESSFEKDRLKAALIRLWLLCRLLEDERIMDEIGLDAMELPDILQDTDHIFDYQRQIQEGINLLRELYLNPKFNCEGQDGLSNGVWAEERWFLYNMLYKYYNKPDEWAGYMNYFYAYLVIKINIGAEMIQSSDLVGFENFQIIQGRKSVLHSLPFETDRMVQLAIKESIRTKNICSLEIRITPHDDWKSDLKEIMHLEALIAREDDEQNEKNKTQFFYVYHFIKEKDVYDKNAPGFLTYCRHHKKRMQIRKQAASLIKFREKAPAFARRVKGIDACSQELGCRPEVFAPTFRKLRAHVCPWQETYERVPQLRTTYHVGEEFLDMIDGLRAIEETVCFLGLCCGDRLGHATVLGLSVQKWYEGKHGLIHISRQDYLDNVVWFYHKLVEFEIEHCERLKDYLLKEFEKYFSELYRKNMTDDYISQMEQKDLTDKKVWRFDIFTYYDAWKLRGDEPELYESGKFVWKDEYILERYLLSPCVPEGDYIRRHSEVTLLYHMYHFHKKVREEGAVEEEIRIPAIYIDGVKKVQREMQHYVSIRGIGIETNPSSNLLISTMHFCHEHPIVNLYNKGLVWDPKAFQECPQLFVSINTDDKGVFYTSLENEYSLMACALEKERDADGKYLYNQQMIYDWLDAIREMGNQQSF